MNLTKNEAKNWAFNEAKNEAKLAFNGAKRQLDS